MGLIFIVLSGGSSFLCSFWHIIKFHDIVLLYLTFGVLILSHILLGCEDGPGVPDMKADDYDNWISESSGCQILDVPDSYISDMNVPVLNGISGFDDILNDNLFIKSGYFGQNLMFDMIDGSMKLPALEETTELVNVHFAGSCEELSKSSDNSNSRLVSHQIKPCDQEADVNLGNIESDEVDFDPQSFIRNFLDLSDMGPDLLPAPVPKETSNRNRITLVLDLDGKRIFLFWYFI